MSASCLFGILRPRQKAGEFVPEPVRGNLAAAVRFLPRRLVGIEQRGQQGLRVQAHDLLLEEDLPDRLEQLQGDAVVLLAEGLLRRLPRRGPAIGRRRLPRR